MAELKSKSLKVSAYFLSQAMAGRKKLTSYPGMAEIQNMTSAAGTRIVQRWEKA